MKFITALLLLGSITYSVQLVGQGSYAPGVGSVGTTAIYKDSSIIQSWANQCSVIRGFQDIADTTLGRTTVGSNTSGIGFPDGDVVSLGDSGYATLTFPQPIINGIGADFVVFENCFNDEFLELAFVEVSEDGINFYRFPSVTEVQDTVQTNSFGSTNPTEIYNFAGKYRAQYGTPFDLSDIENYYGITITTINYVRIVDVIGSINEQFFTTDSEGNKVNDPYPTAFASGGFDLDAVGVINKYVGISEQVAGTKLYPNPFSDRIQIESNEEIKSFQLYTLDGKYISTKYSAGNSLNLSMLESGQYVLKINYQNEELPHSITRIIKL